MIHEALPTLTRNKDQGVIATIEAGDCTAIHFVVLAIAAVHLYYAGLITIGVGVRAGATECLGPIGSESLDMLRMEAVAERMADNLFGHHPSMPGLGKTAQPVHSTSRFEDRLHASMMTTVPCPCKTHPITS
jgi:hypothetical protein